MQKPNLQTILISVLIIVALFTSIYFPYKWKQLSNDFLAQTNQYGELLKQINDLQKEVRELKNGEGEVDDLKDWQIYRNEELGFEVKYPNDWKVNSYEDSQRIDIATVEKDKYLSGVSAPPKGNAWINFIVSPPENYEEFEKKEDNYGSPDSDEFVMILSREIITDNARVVGVATGYWKGDPLSTQYDQIFNQVLSTFKFIEKDETADWKIYRNEKFGFEVRYPSQAIRNSEFNLQKLVFFTSEKCVKEDPYLQGEEFKCCQKVSVLAETIKANFGSSAIPIKFDNLTGEKFYFRIPQNYTINNVPVYRPIGQINAQVRKGICWYKINLDYHLTEEDVAEKLFNKILSTFKFIENKEIIISSPTKGDIWEIGKTYQIQWQPNNSNDKVVVKLYKVPITSLNLKWEPSNPIPNTGSYSFTPFEWLETGEKYQFCIDGVCSDEFLIVSK